MSCECNINLVKYLENKYSPNLAIYKLQGACRKCGSLFGSRKHTEKGVGFHKWSKNFIQEKEDKK